MSDNSADKVVALIGFHITSKIKVEFVQLVSVMELSEFCF
jgi:hypothetical protein